MLTPIDFILSLFLSRPTRLQMFNMKTLLSFLALGFWFYGSYVFAAPATTSALATPASIYSTALEATASGPADVDDTDNEIDIDTDTFSYGQPNLRKMQRKYRRYIRQTLRKRDRSHSCTLDKVSIRKEW